MPPPYLPGSPTPASSQPKGVAYALLRLGAPAGLDRAAAIQKDLQVGKGRGEGPLLTHLTLSHLVTYITMHHQLSHMTT